MGLPAWLGPTSRVRGYVDLAWLGAFALLFALLVLQRSGGAGALASGELLDLLQGAQRQGLYWNGLRVGTLHSTTRRTAAGWRVGTRLLVGGAPAASTDLELYPDLSLAGLRVKADLGGLLKAGGGLVQLLLGQLDGVGRLDVEGRCALETGVCQVKGRVGTKEVSLPITAGRGPVLTSAIYPLLARGSLGQQAELGVFDPLTLGRRILTFRVLGRERLTLDAGPLEAVKIQRDLQGVKTHVWVDRDGRVLMERLPMGLVLKHEAFLDLGEEVER